mgnify:CR=1 FL=1
MSRGWSSRIRAAERAFPTWTRAFALIVSIAVCVDARADDEAPAVVEEAAPAAAATTPGTGIDAEIVKVVVPDFVALTEDVLEAELESITANVVYQLSLVQRLRIVSAADIRHMLDLEASKQVMGCSEDTSCLTEIADALDAPLLVAGQVARLGGRISVSLSLIDAANAAVLQRAQAEGRDLVTLTRALKPAVNTLAERYGGVPGGSVEEQQTSMMRAVVERANDPDTVMLGAMMAMGIIAPFFAPAILVLPILQGVVLWAFGDDLAGRDYPWWLLAIPAGYAALVVGLILSAGLSGASLFAAGFDTNSAYVLAFASTAMIFVTLFVIEPVAVWAAGTFAAVDMEIARRKREKQDAASEESGEANADDDDDTPSSDAEGDAPSSETPPVESAPSEAVPEATDTVRAIFGILSAAR